MNIDVYFKFEKDLSKKSKYNLINYSEDYLPIFLPDKKGNIIIYYYMNKNNVGKEMRKPLYAITMKGNFYLSGVFMPDFEFPNIGYGDVNGTEDALIFIKKNNIIELFIAKGKKNQVSFLYQLITNGELEKEMENLRAKAGSFKNVN